MSEEGSAIAPDTIEREIVVAASIERVWTAITTPSELRSWFGDIAEMDLRPGGKGKVGWTEFGNVTELVVEVVEPPVHFAYQWSAVENVPFERSLSTRVDFRLDDLGDSTRIRLTESGFSKLPPDVAQNNLAENSSGWTRELQDLTLHLELTEV